ncbi:MAG: DUF4364 family protein [Clostridiales bacterium]|jgi:predicted transcriptional regulator|nr:DUF4364 family protein [Clostridiales bacterium]
MHDENLNTINKVIVLFIFDKMDMPITDSTIVELATSRNRWLSYLDCKITLGQLVDNGFLYQTNQENTLYYNITPNGRMCVSHFYNKIPQSLQHNIADFIKENRMSLRRNQEYFRHYFKNPDGTYTVTLKIIDPVQTTLEIKINVANQNAAKQAYERWEEKAATMFFWIHEQLVDS